MPFDDELPSKLFRYRSLSTSYALDEIEKAVFQRRVFLADAISLNDPFEFSPVYVKSSLRGIIEATRRGPNSKHLLTRQKYEELLGRAVTRNEFRLAMKNFRSPVLSARLHLAAGRDIIENLQKRSSVACFSEVSDSIPMWAHYSDNHEGFCIEYDFHSQFESIGTLRFPLKVSYSPNRPIVSTLDIGAFTEKYGSTDPDAADSLAVLDALFLQKSEDWSYEKEWRVFETQKQIRGYQEVATLEVKAIYLGIRVSGEMEQKVKSLVGHAVSVKKAIMSKTSYGFDFE